MAGCCPSLCRRQQAFPFRLKFGMPAPESHVPAPGRRWQQNCRPGHNTRHKASRWQGSDFQAKRGFAPRLSSIVAHFPDPQDITSQILVIHTTTGPGKSARIFRNFCNFSGFFEFTLSSVSCKMGTTGNRIPTSKEIRREHHGKGKTQRKSA